MVTRPAGAEEPLASDLAGSMGITAARVECYLLRRPRQTVGY